MYCCLGTTRECSALYSYLPQTVVGEVVRGIAVLQAEFGEDRNYYEVGGYSLIAETTDDLSGIREIIDFDTHPCEWADRLDGNYLSALYLLNDDFSVVVFMPIAIAPPTLLSELED